jgi:hypothetical protein
MFYLLKKRGFIAKRVIYISVALLLIFFLRNFVFITLSPALAAWMLSERRKGFVFPTFVIVYAFFILFFFSLKFIHPKLDLPQYVSSRQLEFIQIAEKAASSININPLFPDFRSFLNNVPQALNHTLMRPYLSETITPLYLPPAVEILFFELLFLGYLFFPLKLPGHKSFICFGIFLTLSMFLLIGYTIPILGAIVRYRCIYFPFLITPVVCLIDLKGILRIINYKK